MFKAVNTKKSDSLPIQLEGYSWSELRRLVGHMLRAQISVLLRGHPGVGKSTLARVLAAEMGLELIDIRLAQRDPSDLCGVQFPDHHTGSLKNYAPAWALQARDKPCMVFLDEINAGVSRLHQAAAYQIVLERRVGEVSFHPDTVVLAAGNLEEDNAIVAHMSSALCNRFAHFVLRPDVDVWIEWGIENEIDPSILAYIGREGVEALYQPGDAYAFPTPRSWERASRALAGAHPDDRRRLIASCVGDAAAQRFESFLAIYRAVDVAAIVKRGKAVDFRSGAGREPSFALAAVLAVASWLTSEKGMETVWLPNVITFLRSPGLEAEYVLLFLRRIRRDEPLFSRLRQLPAFRELAGELVDLQPSIRQ